MNYEQKYLKYKNKYLQLKTMIGGSIYKIDEIVTNIKKHKVGKIIKVTDLNTKDNIYNEMKVIYDIHYNDGSNDVNVKSTDIISGDEINDFSKKKFTDYTNNNKDIDSKNKFTNYTNNNIKDIDSKNK